MNKDEILKKSQQENRGKSDEREIAAFGYASRVGMLVGAILCIVLVFVSKYWIKIPEIGMVALMVYFAMKGSNDLALYKHLRDRLKLVFGIVSVVCAVALAVALVVKNVG